MRYKPLKYDFRLKRIPRRGSPPDVECPLQGGSYVSFEECLDCEYHLDILESDLEYCLIEKREKEEQSRKEQEEIDREAAEWQAQREEEDRKMREEMTAMRNEMEENRKKWQKEYQKEQEEYEKLQEEWREMDRKRLVSLYGEELIESCERADEMMKSDDNEKENDDDEDE